MSEHFDRPIAELHQAYFWDCDACGAENFARAVTVDPVGLDESQICTLLSFNQDLIDAYQAGTIQGRFVTCPTEVTCHQCKSVFATEES